MARQKCEVEQINIAQKSAKSTIFIGHRTDFCCYVMQAVYTIHTKFICQTHNRTHHIQFYQKLNAYRFFSLLLCTVCVV